MMAKQETIQVTVFARRRSNDPWESPLTSGFQWRRRQFERAHRDRLEAKKKPIDLCDHGVACTFRDYEILKASSDTRMAMMD